VERRTTLHKDTISHTSSSFVFTENRGQLLGTDSVEHPEVKYYTQRGYPSVYFQDTAVSFVFAKMDTSHAFQDTITRVDMKYENSNPDLKIYSLEECDDYSNFFYSHIPEGRCRVQNYKELVTFNVWDSVDVIYGSNPVGLKYYFVCKPLGGGNSASQIDLNFEGADSVHIGPGGELMIYTPQGIIVQRKAQVWQIDGSGNFSALAWQPSYNKIGTCEVEFTSFGSYNSSQSLVISMDWGPVPILAHIAQPEWSMYFGGGGYDEGTAISIDTDGNPYFAGYTESAVFPHIIGQGAYTFGLGMFDAYIAKFGSADGASSGVVATADQHKWTTFYGGSENDIAYGATSVGNGLTGSTYITGSTGSSDFPVFNNGGIYYQTTLKGTTDAFVVRVDNATGGFQLSQNTALWATYFGGNGDECGYAITSDVTGNILIGGRTSTSVYSSGNCIVPSDNGLPTCNSVSGFDNGGSYGGGTSDGLLVQFNNTGILQWSSYYGGENADTIFDVAFSSGDIYITGSTEGGSIFPITSNATSGSYNQSTYGGGATDAFLGQFKSGNHTWCTYFGGDDVDRALAIAVTSDADVLIAGVTASANPACAPACLCDVPATGDFPMCDASGSYFQGTSGVGAHGGLSDGFFARFASNGSLSWSTYYGGEGEDKINDLDVSYLDELFFAGQTTTGLDVTAIEQAGLNAWDYLQGSFNGGTDAMLGYFDTGNQRTWSTWYAHYLYLTDQECGNAIAVRSTGPYVHCWYMTGYTNTVYDQQNSTGFLTEAANAANECCPNTYVQTYIGGDYDAFVTRFSMYDMFMISVEETEVNSTLDANVFPNPSSQTVNVQMNLDHTTDVNILIYSVTGELVYSQKYGSQSGTFTTQIDFSGFAGGVYMLEIQTEDACATKRVIKQ
ncbi:MAG TPA: T9SS type A sorting domain-containing protein, partial [Bacteroidia bacterium]|nr:T9SS type A sorting domain-containing protein [Bacteroidia bacterium]